MLYHLSSSQMQVVHFCTQTPELLCICNCGLQIQMMPYPVWFWGRKIQGFKWWCPFGVLCNSKDIVWSLNHFKTLPFFSLHSFQLQCMLVLLFCSFKFWSMSSWILCILAPVPSIFSYASDWILFLCCTFPVSISPTHFYLQNRWFTFTLYLLLLTCFVDHAMLPCYLHQN